MACRCWMRLGMAALKAFLGGGLDFRWNLEDEREDKSECD
ncbi:hypothetical protein Tco_0631280, partial [Tanacetum coccineum]